LTKGGKKKRKEGPTTSYYGTKGKKKGKGKTTPLLRLRKDRFFTRGAKKKNVVVIKRGGGR